MGRPATVPHVPGWKNCRCAECRKKRGEGGRAKEVKLAPAKAKRIVSLVEKITSDSVAADAGKPEKPEKPVAEKTAADRIREKLAAQGVVVQPATKVIEKRERLCPPADLPRSEVPGWLRKHGA